MQLSMYSLKLLNVQSYITLKDKTTSKIKHVSQTKDNCKTKIGDQEAKLIEYRHKSAPPRRNTLFDYSSGSKTSLRSIHMNACEHAIKVATCIVHIHSNYQNFN